MAPPTPRHVLAPIAIGATLALLAMGLLAALSITGSEASTWTDLEAVGSRCGGSGRFNDARQASLPAAHDGGGAQQSWTDPIHGTCIVRVSNHDDQGIGSYLRNDYSRRQAFNVDNTRFLLQGGNEHWYLHDGSTQANLGRLDPLRGVTEPQWDRWNQFRIHYLPKRGGLSIRSFDLESRKTSVLVDFTGRLPWSNAAHVWTRGEGSPSADQQYWGFQVEDADRNILGLMVWDRDNDSIATSDLSDGSRGRPDHVSMSPSGEFMVVAFPGQVGVRAYTRDFQRGFKVNQRESHSDLARLPNGHDAYVSIDYDRDGGPLYYVDLHNALDVTGAGEMATNRVTLLNTYVNGSATALHISGRGTDKPGWVVVSTYESSGERQWFHNRIFAMQLKRDGQFIGLADHHSAVNEYHAEPHASVSRDFRRVVFNSNWGRTNRTDIDAYLVEVSPGGF